MIQFNVALTARHDRSMATGEHCLCPLVIGWRDAMPHDARVVMI